MKTPHWLVSRKQAAEIRTWLDRGIVTRRACQVKQVVARGTVVNRRLAFQEWHSLRIE